MALPASWEAFQTLQQTENRHALLQHQAHGKKFRTKLVCPSFFHQVITLFPLLSFPFCMWQRLLSLKAENEKVLASWVVSGQKKLVCVRCVSHLNSIVFSSVESTKRNTSTKIPRGFLLEAGAWRSSRWLKRARFLPSPHLTHQFSAPPAHWNHLSFLKQITLGTYSSWRFWFNWFEKDPWHKYLLKLSK